MTVKPFKTPPTHSNYWHAVASSTPSIMFFSFVTVALLSFLPLHMWHGFFILTSCVLLADSYCLCLCYNFVFRRRRGILRLVVYCWRRKQSNGYEELPGRVGRKALLPTTAWQLHTHTQEGVVSDRIGNPDAYPKRSLSSFAIPSRKDGK